ncbi:hypothetical protein DICPUDRAFT_83124 [Dictyostelium purpureum]|uniref:FNIP repeat-containing protein n=1 Tax=Dictyostelium purpureum TaxID=5786 RepID=F0ZYL7_DICPU|nr:uncharacterized protein DICPUDRAFT_83124 [Dictyostelium purpureum]EGC30963.1 hypothetical protein DICPUDRAFT_83124 [Dictyostelium purpureum]|eukprot:XP_003292514.1 hypothetical protein DICPUDRAFT_83124 [Dictyostelium purpureum]
MIFINNINFEIKMNNQTPIYNQAFFNVFRHSNLFFTENNDFIGSLNFLQYYRSLNVRLTDSNQLNVFLKLVFYSRQVTKFTIDSNSGTSVLFKIFSPFIITQNLTSLKLAYMEYNVPIKPGMIPIFPENGLTKLYITNSFNQPIIQNVLPKTLKELKIGTSFTQELYFESIPDSVTFLTLDCPYYNHQFAPGILPRNLIKLKIGNNVPLLPGSLPESLTYLKLCCDFNQPITANLLPKNLKKISFGSRFQKERLARGHWKISISLSFFPRSIPDQVSLNFLSLVDVVGLLTDDEYLVADAAFPKIGQYCKNVIFPKISTIGSIDIKNLNNNNSLYLFNSVSVLQ